MIMLPWCEVVETVWNYFVWVIWKKSTRNQMDSRMDLWKNCGSCEQVQKTVGARNIMVNCLL